MKKKHLLSPSYLSLIVLLVMTCISCAHQHTNDSAALDSIDANDQHVWAETKDVGESVAAEEVAPEEKAPAADMTAETVASNNEVAQEAASGGTVTAAEKTDVPSQDLNTQKEEEAGMEAMLTAADAAIASEAAQKAEEPTKPLMVAKLDNPNSDPEVVAQSPQETFQANKDIYIGNSEKREPAEAKVEENNDARNTTVPSVGVPSEVKDTGVSQPHKSSGKRSSVTTEPKKVEAVAPKQVTPTTTQDTQVKVTKPATPVVASRDMEESFGHEPIPGKQQIADDEEANEAQLASVQIANFIEHHVTAVIIGIVGFIAGLYFFMRKNKENDQNSI